MHNQSEKNIYNSKGTTDLHVEVITKYQFCFSSTGTMKPVYIFLVVVLANLQLSDSEYF